MSTSTSSRRSRVGTVALWALQIAAASMFLFAGASKLAGVAVHVQLFDAIGVGQWFRYLTGSIEVVAALLLLVPQLAVFGALLLIPTMIGAVLTHFVIGGTPIPALVLLAASGAIAWARRHEVPQFHQTFHNADPSRRAPSGSTSRQHG